jgi:hypothetical protein
VGEALTFILQRLYISLSSGFIINIYILCTFFVLEKTGFSPDYLPSFKSIVYHPAAIWGFIFIALIIGIFIEGFFEIGSQYYQENYGKLLKQDNRKAPPVREYGKLNFSGKVLFLLFSVPSTFETCKHFWACLQENGKKMLQVDDFTFMYDPISKKLPDDPDSIVSTMQINALNISRELKNEYFYRHRDLSFISQIMRSSFLLLALFYFIATLFVALSWILNWCRDGKIECLFWFCLICCITSALFVVFTTLMALNFSKRYIRNLGKCYIALGFHEKAAKTAEVNSPAAVSVAASEGSRA